MKQAEVDLVRSTHEKHEKCIQNFGQKTWKEESTQRPRRRWKAIRMDLGEI